MKHSIKSSWWGRVRRWVLGLAALLGLAGGARAQGPVFDRVTECGQGINYFSLEQLAVDGAGNVYAAGAFRGMVAFGGILLSSAGGGGTGVPGGGVDNDWWVAKLDAAGAVVWAVRGGGAGDDQAHALALDGQGHVYVAGAGGSAVWEPEIELEYAGLAGGDSGSARRGHGDVAVAGPRQRQQWQRRVVPWAGRGRSGARIRGRAFGASGGGDRIRQHPVGAVGFWRWVRGAA